MSSKVEGSGMTAINVLRLSIRPAVKQQFSARADVLTPSPTSRRLALFFAYQRCGASASKRLNYPLLSPFIPFECIEKRRRSPVCNARRIETRRYSKDRYARAGDEVVRFLPEAELRSGVVGVPGFRIRQATAGSWYSGTARNSRSHWRQRRMSQSRRHRTKSKAL
jgi:hypothetical protein